jgi:hypothetical protein
MVDHSGYTLRQFAPDRLGHVRDAIKQAQSRDATLKSKKLPGVAMGVAEKAVTEKLLDALRDVDLFDMIAHAWAKTPEVKDAAEAAGQSVNQTSGLRLGEHDLSIDLLPLADITFATFGRMTLEFKLELSVALSTADVTISRGMIVKIGKTEGHVSAALSCGPLSLGHPLKTKILFHDELVLRNPVEIIRQATAA